MHMGVVMFMVMYVGVLVRMSVLMIMPKNVFVFMLMNVLMQVF